MQNIDTTEVNKFSAQAEGWWDKNGPQALLHQINQVRLEYVLQNIKNPKACNILDVGCGAGIFTESIANHCNSIIGIDASSTLIAAAREHAKISKLTIDYIQVTAEDFAVENSEQFDVVVCLELIEHVPCINSLVQALAKLVKPTGLVFISTINRNILAYLGTIVFMEYLTNNLEKGTHNYAKFITPSELAKVGRNHDLSMIDLKGMQYNPITRISKITTNPQINYIACFQSTKALK